jgi:phospholipase C
MTMFWVRSLLRRQRASISSPVPAIAGPQPRGAFEARCGYGPRLPLVLISPWSKRNFVDHTTTDQSSSLRFVEDNWQLGFIDGPSTPPPGPASSDRIAGSVVGMFDFDDRPNRRPLIRDMATGEAVKDDDHRSSPAAAWFVTITVARARAGNELSRPHPSDRHQIPTARSRPAIAINGWPPLVRPW